LSTNRQSGTYVVTRNRALGLPVAAGAALFGTGLLLPAAGFSRAFIAASLVLLLWAGDLYLATRRAGRSLSIRVVARPQHWVQALAQTAILLYWGRHVSFVYAYIPMIVAQLVFAYGVEALVRWSRHDDYILGFGPFPIILSMNLFLWFKPEWFFFQFAMILLGYLAKGFVHWQREGRAAHIFNPSSFPLAIASLALIAAGASNITFGEAIASSQFYPPNIYLVIFLAAIPGQLLFGVATMTIAAVVTLYGISSAYFALNGTYLFYDTHIPIAIFLGMHLILTDPSTSPRSLPGRIVFGMLYGAGAAIAYALLEAYRIPSFYDKLLPIPFLNLMVRRFDHMAADGRLRWLDPSRLGFRLPTMRLKLVPTAVWTGVFVSLLAIHGIGDTPRGQSLAFWQEACRAGHARACLYNAQMTFNYCNEGSGWACNERGIQLAAAGRPATKAFERSCQLGFPAGCENATHPTPSLLPARAGPLPADLPIVLRGTKPRLKGWSGAALQARACAQGWPGFCDALPKRQAPGA
jgi:hypothetical protein